MHPKMPGASLHKIPPMILMSAKKYASDAQKLAVRTIPVWTWRFILSGRLGEPCRPQPAELSACSNKKYFESVPRVLYQNLGKSKSGQNHAQGKGISDGVDDPRSRRG
jgi:hypothetical protein